MKIFNIGIPELVFILILALIVIGPDNMVKTARDAGVFIRKVTKSPYWKEVWATKKELNEIPKILAKEANLNETIRDLNRESSSVSSSIASSVSELIKEVNQPLEVEPQKIKTEKETKKETPAPSESIEIIQSETTPADCKESIDSEAAASADEK